jgi:thymidylate synthase ThyX
LSAPQATIIKDDPIVEVIGYMQLDHEGVMNMAKWVEKYRPNCLPEGGFNDVLDLMPHDGFDIGLNGEERAVTDNELLCEIAGRKCYDSFADAGAKRTNGEYLRSMWQGRVPHRSTGYHAKISFFFAHISRRVSHELIRNYVGSDRDEEGSPSQESTRFTHHPGVYIAHPYCLDKPEELLRFERSVQLNYEEYVETIQRKVSLFEAANGKKPVGLDKKRIYESTAGDLHMSCGTSFIWTTNSMALTKFFHERDDEAADMEMCRFARTVKRVCLQRWPNLFPDFVPARSA